MTTFSKEKGLNNFLSKHFQTPKFHYSKYDLMNIVNFNKTIHKQVGNGVCPSTNGAQGINFVKRKIS